VTLLRRLSVALKKELRALAPAWLITLAVFAVSPFVASEVAGGVMIGIYFLGAVSLGALSMGHEYSGGTLSLLLSQPRSRPAVLLLKLSVLIPLLLTLGAAFFVLGDRFWNDTLLVVVPLLCGLFIAPWLTMLCRSSLAGIVFTSAMPGLLLIAGQMIVAAVIGVNPEATVPNELRMAVVLWGIVVVSVLAAVSGWRLFMRLEALDGRGEAIHLTWHRQRTSEAAGPSFARRSPRWLLFKKELRLQQLSFVVGGIYLVGWLGIWLGKSAMPNVYASLVFVLTGVNAFAVPVLAGSLASAEERQLGTLEWHALLPAPASMQWAMKAGIAVAVAFVLGVAVPMALAWLSGSHLIQDGMRPFLSVGTVFAVILLAVVSVYVSSLSANAMQALLWSIAAGGGAVFVLSETISGFNPFAVVAVPWWWLQAWRFWPWWIFAMLPVMAVLVALLYVGSVGMLLRFARTNHRSAEWSAPRIARQLISIGAFVAIVMSVWFAVGSRFRVEANAYSQEMFRRTYGFLTVAAVDSQNRPTTRFTVVVIREAPSHTGRNMAFSLLPGGSLLPGNYFVVAVDPAAWDVRSWPPDEAAIARLKARATPLTIAAGESKTIQLTLASH
jgi:hypothetical protein